MTIAEPWYNLPVIYTNYSILTDTRTTSKESENTELDTLDALMSSALYRPVLSQRVGSLGASPVTFGHIRQGRNK